MTFLSGSGTRVGFRKISLGMRVVFALEGAYLSAMLKYYLTTSHETSFAMHCYARILELFQLIS